MGTTTVVDEKRRKIFIEYFNKRPTINPNFKLGFAVSTIFFIESIFINLGSANSYIIYMLIITGTPFLTFISTYIFSNPPFFWQRLSSMVVLINLLNSIVFRILYETLPFFKENYYWVIL